MTRIKLAVDIIGLAGAGAVVEGVREIYPPAALILVGVLAVAFAWLMAGALNGAKS